MIWSRLLKKFLIKNFIFCAVLLLHHVIVCYVLVTDTRGTKIGEKMTKCVIGGKGGVKKDAFLRVMYFLNESHRWILIRFIDKCCADIFFSSKSEIVNKHCLDIQQMSAHWVGNILSLIRILDKRESSFKK